MNALVQIICQPDGVDMNLRGAWIGLAAVTALLTGLTATAAVGVPGPAPGGLSGGVTPAARDDPLAEAAAALRSEATVLVRLNALRAPVPAALVDVHDRSAEALTGLDHDALLGRLDDADAAGAAAMRRALSQDIPLTPACRRVLARLGPVDLELARGGRAIGIDPELYARALSQLTERVGTSSGAVAGSQVGAPSQQGTGSAASLLALIAAGAAVGLVGAGMIGLLLQRRSRPSAGVGPPSDGRGDAGQATRPTTTGADHLAALDQLLDAGRRMTRALDAVQTARIAVTEAISMTGAARGAFVRVADQGMTVLDDPDGVLQPRQLDVGLLRRVADTGQSAVQVCRDEPALTGLPCSVLAVPVAGSGRVVGVMLLVRPDVQPFNAADERVVSRLAPMVGSALLAAEQHVGVSELTRVDALTGLPNRRRLDADLAALAERARDGGPAPGALVMIDVDHFKLFNDRNGHAAGDVALRVVADALRAAVREVDTPYRYGGEEFSLVLRDVDVAGAAEIAERVRSLVEACDVAGARTQPAGRLTVSIGLAMLAGAEPMDVLRRADEALYQAKQDGRNRVVAVTGRGAPVHDHGGGWGSG